jgi:hypothetical protein
MTDTAFDEKVDVRVHTLRDIILSYDGPEDRLAIFLGNFRRVVAERERLSEAAQAALRVFEMFESQVDIGSRSITEAMTEAQAELRSVLWSLTS